MTLLRTSVSLRETKNVLPTQAFIGYHIRPIIPATVCRVRQKRILHHAPQYTDDPSLDAHIVGGDVDGLHGDVGWL